MSDAARSAAPVGFAYQAEMLQHRGPRDHHPEKPERLTAVLEALQQSGLVDQCRELPARTASDTELLRVHTAEHLASVAASACAVAEHPDDRSLQVRGPGARAPLAIASTAQRRPPARSPTAWTRSTTTPRPSGRRASPPAACSKPPTPSSEASAAPRLRSCVR